MTKPNVFFLTVDSLRYDYFSAYQSEITDLIDGVEYTNAVSTATQTSSSMPMLSTGAFTDELDTWGLPESGSPRPISEVLHDYGYATGLWTDNYLFGSEYNYDRGFDGGDLGKPTYKKRMSNAIRDGPLSPLFPIAEWSYFNVYKRVTQSLGGEENFYRPAETLNEAAHAWRVDQDEPVFSWIHYMDPHHPFEPPVEYLDRYEFNGSWSRSELSEFTRTVLKTNGKGYSEPEIEDVRTAYRAACDYQGDALLDFIERLIEDGSFYPDRDVLVVTADHGESLTPDRYNMMGHVPPALWEGVIRVPLIVGLPEWNRDKVYRQATLASLYDTIRLAVESSLPNVNTDSYPNPVDLTTEVAHFATNWEEPTEGTIRTYRGVRTEAETKLFGGHIDGEDAIILVRYDRDELEDEVLYRSDGTPPPPDDDALVIWEELTKLVEERGPLLGEHGSLDGEIDEQHLRDLGYIQ